jgi:hypothetical protein
MLFQVVVGTSLQAVLVEPALLTWQIHLLVDLDMFRLMEMAYQNLLQVLDVHILCRRYNLVQTYTVQSSFLCVRVIEHSSHFC